MKKNIIFIIMIIVLMMTGCSEKDQEMTSFIPTPIPESEDSNGNTASEGATEGAQETPTPKPLHVGQTTTKYVKLGEYDAILNVRSTPSKDGEVVGFLVHTEKIEVVEIVDGWASFAKGNEMCYVSADFLVDERPEYIAPPSPSPKPKNTPKPENTPTPKVTPKVENTPVTDSDEAPPEI